MLHLIWTQENLETMDGIKVVMSGFVTFDQE